MARANTGVRSATKALKFAKQVILEAEDWTTAYNRLFGLGGEFSRMYPNEQDRTGFANSKEYKQIMELLGQLREERGDPSVEIAELAESTNGKILVRVPKILHAALLAEAESEGVSLNQLCLTKLSLRIQTLS